MIGYFLKNPNASTIEDTRNGPEKAIDDDLGTFFSSISEREAWLKVEIYKPSIVHKVTIIPPGNQSDSPERRKELDGVQVFIGPKEYPKGMYISSDMPSDELCGIITVTMEDPTLLNGPQEFIILCENPIKAQYVILRGPMQRATRISVSVLHVEGPTGYLIHDN